MASSFSIVKKTKKDRTKSQDEKARNYETEGKKKKKSSPTSQDLESAGKKENTAEEVQSAIQVFTRSIYKRFLFPNAFHIIAGIVLFDNIDRRYDELIEQGVFSSINFLSKITSVNYERANGIIGMTLNSKNIPNTPWRLLYECLKSLGNADAMNFASSVEKFGLRVENLSKLEIESPAPKTDRFYGMKVCEVNSRTDLAEGILTFLKTLSEFGYYAFVRKGKRAILPEMDPIEIIVNKKLCDFMGLTVEDWVLYVTRVGFPEFIALESYYSYWQSVFDEINGEYKQIQVRIKTKDGGYRYAKQRKCERKIFSFDGDFYLVIAQNFDLGEFALKNLKEFKATEELNTLKTKEFSHHLKEYNQSILQFVEQFYPESLEKLKKPQD